MIFTEKVDLLIESLKKLKEQKEIVDELIENIIYSYSNGGKVIVFGNGGSASDALHMCAELQGRFFIDRNGLDAVCLNSNISTITAIANDFGYSEIFKKQLEGCLNKNDVVIGISTSGNSENVIKAIEFCSEKNVNTYTLSGKDGGKLKNICEKNIIVPSNITPHIQEMHIFLIHHICDVVEKTLFEKGLI